MSERGALPGSPSDEITVLLRRAQSGDGSTLKALLELVYPELRALARAYFRRERPDHVLQPTALVNEAYLRLVAHEHHDWRNRAHFFGAAAQIMRRILVDYARAGRAQKRGGDHVSLSDIADPVADGRAVEILALDDALDELEKLSARQARIVELRYFGGLSVSETAEALGVNARTVDRDWAAARTWLRRRLRP
jgi:RNA polymerase sigma factor (TIGR02999 family)